MHKLTLYTTYNNKKATRVLRHIVITSQHFLLRNKTRPGFSDVTTFQAGSHPDANLFTFPLIRVSLTSYLDVMQHFENSPNIVKQYSHAGYTQAKYAN